MIGGGAWLAASGKACPGPGARSKRKKTTGGAGIPPCANFEHAEPKEQAAVVDE